ncbi:hypothetical protein [Sphingobacterium faecium]|uniref:hypothetical protein n=1 Tax=Sphingobacterium faecium TaxID=34087 RepID=UPI0024683DDC|nr:hypothetical protein [Sphingobacterium faecium]MDH5825722.1 hypothetical protein [Sphingobacterium faecium]
MRWIKHSKVNIGLRVSELDGTEKSMTMNRNYEVEFEVSIPARSQTWYVIK